MEIKTPRNHQLEAILAIKQELQSVDRTTVVMACGTGKTLVAVWATQQLNYKKIVLFLPSIALVAQVLKDWKEEYGDTADYLCVCSDQTVSNDDLQISQDEIDCRVTTNSSVIQHFLSTHADRTKIIFSTYHSSELIGSACGDQYSFDVGIFDEAHRTASEKESSYSYALQQKNIPIAKRMFFTATPRHRNISKKNSDQMLFSMDNEELYGKICYQLSFRKAVELGLICDYKVIISTITSDMLSRELLKDGITDVEDNAVAAERAAQIIALKSAIEASGAQKIISYHSTVASAKSFAQHDKLSDIYLDKFAIDHINGKMPSDKRTIILDKLAKERTIITNARCLTEGVDVPSIDMVAFMSPKKSKIDIIQSVGRAMRTSPGKEIGYVFIPLFIDINTHEDIESAVAATDFDTIFEVIQSLSENDEIIHNAINMPLFTDEERAERTRRFKDKVSVIGSQISLDKISNAITTRIIDTVRSSWYYWYERYTKESSNVPFVGSACSWGSVQRKSYKEQTLSQEKIDLLNKINFEWVKHKKLDIMVKKLSKFMDKSGNVVIPQIEENRKIIQYIHNANKSIWRGIGSKRTEEILKKLNIYREPIDREKNWEDGFKRFCDFKNKFGHGRVPKSYGDELLTKWVSRQRKYYHDNSRKIKILTPERKRLLESMGFIWNVFESSWNKQFKEHKKNPNTSRARIWFSSQKYSHRDGKLTRERKKLLDSIGINLDNS